MTSLLCCRDRGRCIATAPLRFEARERRGIDPLSLSTSRKNGRPPLWRHWRESAHVIKSAAGRFLSAHTHTIRSCKEREKEEILFISSSSGKIRDLLLDIIIPLYIYISAPSLISDQSAQVIFSFFFLSVSLLFISSSCRWRRSSDEPAMSHKRREEELWGFLCYWFEDPATHWQHPQERTSLIVVDVVVPVVLLCI